MKHDVLDGKYTVEFNEKTGAMHALRHGEPWRDLCGDNLVYGLLCEVDRLRKVVSEVHSWIVCSPIAALEDMMQSAERICQITEPGYRE